MKLHKCEKCGYETKYTSHMKNHLNRKTPCDRVKTLPPEPPVLPPEPLNLPKELPILLPAIQNTSQQLPTGLYCKNCLCTFTRKDNLNRHLKLNKCKKAKDDINELKNKLEKVEEELKKLKEQPPKIVNKINKNSHNKTNNYYCVPLDNRSVKQVFDRYYDSDVFYAGPDMVIKLLYEELFNKEIFLLDYGRQKFQYKCTVEKDKEGKVVIDIKNENALDKISKEYQRHTYCISEEELVKYRDNMRQTEIIEETANKHDEASKTLNVWSKKWSRVLSS